MMKVIIPLNPDNLGGKSIITDKSFKVMADRDKIVLLKFYTIPSEIKWFESFDLMYCQRQHDQEIFKVVRKATDEERRVYRVPLWIQSEEIPECCGLPMFFVGQIDDNTICTDRPQNADLWWHDASSFYVFTCPKCLGVKAIGQQY